MWGEVSVLVLGDVVFVSVLVGCDGSGFFPLGGRGGSTSELPILVGVPGVTSSGELWARGGERRGDSCFECCQAK